MATTHSSDSKKTASSQGATGNVANDSQRASEAGKKGGQHSHSGSHGSPGSQQETGDSARGNFANDSEKASEAGRKGGQHSHGGSSK
jgi:hypothetical protein